MIGCLVVYPALKMLKSFNPLRLRVILFTLLIQKIRAFLKKQPYPADQIAEIQPEILPIKQEEKIPLKKTWDISCFQVPEHPEKIRFHDMNLPVQIMHGIFDCKFEYCTPVQAEILPKALQGSDVTGRAQTGTGKSAAFLITIYKRLMEKRPDGKKLPGTPRALILAPTRELVLQIQKDAEKIGRYTKNQIISVFGGMDYEKQKKMLQNRIFDLMVATPGRLIDFKKQGIINLSKVEILVIDEADRMLDMGFIPDVRKIVYSTPDKKNRQTMFFSATLTPEVIQLASQWTRNPFQVEIEPDQVASKSINQVTYIVTDNQKFTLLYNLILQQNLERVLVFSNTREETRNLVQKLRLYNIDSSLLSGEISQIKRIQTLEDFKKGKIRVLVATDVAARGIHVDAISHVINYTLPQDSEDYVHRIGRTGRAGETGISISFASENDSFYIPAIEKLLGHKMECLYPAEELLTPLQPLPPRKQGSNPTKHLPGRQARKTAYDTKSKKKKSDSNPRKYRKPRTRPRTGNPKPRTE
jgi:ATP-dependent RNA helicase RhlB